MKNSEARKLLFKRLYGENFPPLVRFACRFTTADAAKDIVQDVFVEFWEKAHVRYDDASCRAYLFTSVRNRCINLLEQELVRDAHIRNIQTDNRLLELDYCDSPEKSMLDDEHIRLVYRQIELLPDKCRQIFRLAYCEDRKSHEIADILQLSVRTVEHQLYLALKTLRKKLTGK
ncbi:MAG: RNA polymerase sigma-70 factor [Tannerella sp.]|nr:RNA polymerase sigma-70 factor [Tannerella sp.]